MNKLLETSSSYEYDSSAGSQPKESDETEICREINDDQTNANETKDEKADQGM